MVLSDGRKSFRIGLAVLIQYRSMTDTQPPSHPASQPRCRSYYAQRSGVEPKNPVRALGLTLWSYPVGSRSGTTDGVRVANHRTSRLQFAKPGLGLGRVSPQLASDAQFVRASDLPAALERPSQHQVRRHRMGKNAE